MPPENDDLKPATDDDSPAELLEQDVGEKQEVKEKDPEPKQEKAKGVNEMSSDEFERHLQAIKNQAR